MPSNRTLPTAKIVKSCKRNETADNTLVFNVDLLTFCFDGWSCSLVVFEVLQWD